MKFIEQLAERKVNRQALKASRKVLDLVHSDRHSYEINIGFSPIGLETPEHMQRVADRTIEITEQKAPETSLQYDKGESMESSKRVFVGATGGYACGYALRPTLVFHDTSN